MIWKSLAALSALLSPANALVRFGCSQLVVQRLDPLVTPGMAPSPHVHQILGGNAFNASMPPVTFDPAKRATCTTCQAADDFSNYWTATLYFRARNGTFKRVPQKGNVGFEGQRGGMTVYYMQNHLADYQQRSKVTAFRPGFRMFVGDATATTKEQADRYRQLTYTCLENMNTRFPETKDFPKKPCPAGIMVNVRFPTCWDGKNLDSPDHMSHMAYPASGTFESNGPCPASHPVRVAQVLFETIFDTAAFNNRNDWPTDGSQPFVWSFGDRTGFANHGDYLFGWKDDALQKILDEPCYVNCRSMRTQTMAQMNACSMQPVVNEQVDGWLPYLPGFENLKLN